LSLHDALPISGVDATVGSARREFPFGFGRQTFVGPPRVCVRVVPRHVHDGKFRLAFGNLSPSPMRRSAMPRGRNESLIFFIRYFGSINEKRFDTNGVRGVFEFVAVVAPHFESPSGHKDHSSLSDV